MAGPRDAKDCLKWIEDQQVVLDHTEFGPVNKHAVDEELTEHSRRSQAISEYQPHVDRLKQTTRDPKQVDNMTQAFDKLTAASGRRSKCLETMSEIAGLEQVFASLSNSASDKAAGLVKDAETRGNDVTSGSGDAAISESQDDSQSYILAMRDSWAWLSRLMKCAETHIQNAAEYQKFFFDVRELSRWMSTDMKKSEQRINPPNVADSQQTETLLADMRETMASCEHWRGKVEVMIDRARKLVPVHLRTTKLAPNRPVYSLTDYKTKQVSISEGEELKLMNNEDAQSWTVRTRRGVTTAVPSSILVIPGPDPEAEAAAAKLRAQFQNGWNDVIKNTGKKLIDYLAKVIPYRWTPQEEKRLRSLNPAAKQNVLNLLDTIDRTFSPFWDPYRPYKALKGRSDRLRELLHGPWQQAAAAPCTNGDGPNSDPQQRTVGGRGGVAGPAATGTAVGEHAAGTAGTRGGAAASVSPSASANGLLLNGGSHQNEPEVAAGAEALSDALNDFTECWSTWAPLMRPLVPPSGASSTNCRRQFLPVVDTNSGQHRFMDDSDWLKQVQDQLEFDDEPGFEEYGEYEEWTMKPVEAAAAAAAGDDDDEVITIETSTETAETAQLVTSEQEERQTFVITAVIDPRNGEQISLDRAVALGIINQRNGTYVNPWTRDAMPIPTAMNAGKIKVEFTTTKKSDVKRSDFGLITIKMCKEVRPFTIKMVIDAKTEAKMTVDEAQKAGVLNQKRGIYVNKNTGEELSLVDALDSGLLVVEFDNSAKTSSAAEPEATTKTYAVHAVSDVRAVKRVSFSEAMASGLIDEQTGAYRNNRTGETMYIGDAIRKGFIRATVVKDPKSLDLNGPGITRLSLDHSGTASTAAARFGSGGVKAAATAAFQRSNGGTSNGGDRL